MDEPNTSEHEETTQLQRAFGKLKENPFIPIGFVATCGALGMAVRRMHQRDAAGYQRWLRARVVAQGLTVVAIVMAGLKEYDKFFGKRAVPEIKVPPAERRAFEKRLKEAEDAHAVETGVQANPLIDASTTPVISASSNAAKSGSWFSGWWKS